MSKKILNEPQFVFPLNKLDVVKTLNWYNQNIDYNDALSWATEYILKDREIDISNAITKEFIVYGYVARMIDNGLILPDNNIKWFNDKTDEIISRLNVNKANVPKAIKKSVPVPDNTNLVISEIESLFDNQILNNFRVQPSFTIIQSTKHINKDIIIEYSEKKIEEFNSIQTDDQLIEAYSNFSNTIIRKIIEFFKSIISICKETAQSIRKSVRKKSNKAKDLSKMLKYFKYCKRFEELNIDSIDPKKIIGASAVWIYNTKYRKLTRLVSKDALGLNIHRSCIQNIDETQSKCKTLRKPKDSILEILDGGKVFLREFFNNLTTKESKLTNRINEEIVILRIQ